MNLVAILSTGISSISTIVTIVILLTLFLWKIKPKTESGRISTLWAIPFVILILLSIGLIGATIGANYEGGNEKNMDDIVINSNSIIESSRQRLNLVNLELYHLSLPTDYVFLRDKLENDTEVKLMRNNEYLRDIEKAEERARPFEKWIKTLTLNPCSYHRMVTMPIAMKADLRSYTHEAVELLATSIMSIINSLDRGFYKKLREIENVMHAKSFGKRKVENGVNLRKKILDNFKSDMNNAHAISRRWNEEMIEKMSVKNIKIIVIISCSILILLSVTSIVIIVFGSKGFFQKHSAIYKPTLLLITGFFSSSISLVVIAISLGVFGKCSLREDNVGLKEFLSPIPGNEQLSICHARNLSFYSSLGNDTVVTFEDLATAFEIEQHRETYRSLILSSMHTLTVHKQFEIALGNVETVLGKLEDLCQDGCFPNDGGKTCEYRDVVKDAFLVAPKIKSMIDRYNSFLVNPKKNQIIDNVFDLYYANYFLTLVKFEIIPTQKEVVAADFSCDLLIDKFAPIGRTICDQIESLVDLLVVFLTVVVVLFSVYLILNILMFKYSCKGNQKVKLDMENKTSSQSAD